MREKKKIIWPATNARSLFGETLFHASLLVDVGELAFGKKDTFFSGAGYEYWKKKFGNNSANTPGTEANTPFLNVEWHL